MNIGIIPSDAKLGAQVCGIDVSKPLSRNNQQLLRDALAKHLVLRFREQTITVDEHIRFAQTFGELGAIADTLLGMGKRKFQPDEIPECVSVVSNIKVDGKNIGSLGDGECFWHSDSCFADTPPSASLLYSLEIPAAGGSTAFLNMVDALESLPQDLRARIEGQSIRHSQIYDSTGAKRAAFDEIADITKAPGPIHPIIRTIGPSNSPSNLPSESPSDLPDNLQGNSLNNRQCLYLGRRLGAYIVGFSIDESEALLDALWTHTVREQRIWSHDWQLGDLVVWDNRFTMHHRDPFDANARRRLHKVQVAGERPV
ncbi:MAG: taurine dioxygenase [Gammaproteobacteria bacterium]|jgi:taurine dioxygenase